MADINPNIESKLLKTTADFLKEINSPWAHRNISLAISLEEDLGIDSLKRAELIHRVESAFQVTLQDNLISEANTLKHIAIAVAQAKPKILAEPRQFALDLEQAYFNPEKAVTLIEVLHGYAQKEPQRPHIYLQDDSSAEEIISYGQLLEIAAEVAAGLQQRGFVKGDTAAIMLPSTSDFFYAFFGILLAGGIPVPIYPPVRPDQIEEYAKREVLILRNAGVKILITFNRAEILGKLLQPFIPSLLEVTTVDALRVDEAENLHLSFKQENPALIQYTSGSTDAPKGVLLTHGNLLANIRAYGKGINITPSDRVVSWLPLYHDMGLIGSWLGSFYYGLPVTIMSPLSFLVRPERWLWNIHYNRATISAAPNFAYELCMHRVKNEMIEGLNLSSWRLALNGAEAIYPKTIRAFTQRFSEYGFKSQAFFPVYGLAESSLALTFPPLGREPKFDKIEHEAFDKDKIAKPVDASATKFHEFVSCGKALPNHDIRIVDDNNQVMAERHIGRLQFRGPSAMQGYYRNSAATSAICYDGWYDSGDLAYIADDELYVTGRKKDIIIKAGRNLYPEEIEEIASHAIGIRKGCIIAFGISDPDSGTEKLVVTAEVHQATNYTLREIRDDVIKKVTVQLGIPPDEVVLIPARSIPKTSSGKLRRSECKNKYLSGKLSSHKMPLWFQLSKLFVRGVLKRIKEWLSFAARLTYTAYFILILAIVASPLWLAMVLLPQAIRKKINKAGIKLLVKLAGWRVAVNGTENLNKHWPLIIVANHSSYVDSLLLMAYMPTNCLIVGKREVLGYPMIGTFVKKLGYLTVDRMDFSQNAADIASMEGALKNNDALLIFPEGGIRSETGLRPFKSGAFKIAVETKTPICPMSIKGTRSILRGSKFIMRPHAITITINPLIHPQAEGWAEISRLSEQARKQIAKYCGERMIS